MKRIDVWLASIVVCVLGAALADVLSLFAWGYYRAELGYGYFEGMPNALYWAYFRTWYGAWLTALGIGPYLLILIGLQVSGWWEKIEDSKTFNSLLA